MGMTDSTRTFMERQQLVSARHAMQQREAKNLVEQYWSTAPAHFVNKERQNKREQYQKRIAKRAVQYLQYSPPPPNLSPWLDLRTCEGDFEYRMGKYNLKHNCPHGNKYTSFYVHSHILSNGEKKHSWLQLTCFCTTEKVTSKTVAHHCGKCTNRNLNIVVDHKFPGDILRCRFCHYNWYRTIGWTRRRQHYLTVAAPVEQKFISTKTWNRLPPQPIDATEEFGISDILSPIKEFFDSCIAWCKQTAAMLLEMAMESLAKKILKTIWETIIELLQRIWAEAIRRPSSFALAIWTFLTTNSVVERSFAFASIVLETDYAHLWNNLLAGLSGREELEMDEVPNFQDAQEQAGWFEADNPPTFKEVITNSMEFQFISYIFGLRKWLPKTAAAFGLIKDFNAAMSGWKNMHELVNQLIEYLPSWFTKAFTITDPVKRFGTEAKTPGNPVYSMLQSYLAMLHGQNCASARAFEEFTERWKECDAYVNSEFAPSDRVLRLLAHYRTSAHAIMRPGTNGSKPIPYVITLFGMPGQGKSASWPLLVSGITGGSMEEIRMKSYTRNSTSAFFDGYCPEKHKIFVYDDFGSQVDDEAAGELMSIVSNADYLPPFGSMTDPNVGVKGTSFDSPLVVLCSNFKEFSQCKQIADKTALQRRLGVIINWHERLDVTNQNQHRQRYQMFRAGTDGKQYPIAAADGSNYHTFEEIQVFLRDDYVKHLGAQKALDDEFNKLLCKKPLLDFCGLYETARKNIRSVDATEQTGFSTAITLGMGYYGLLKMTYEFADYMHPRWVTFLKYLTYFGLGYVAVTSALSMLFGKKMHREESGEGAVAKAAPKPIFMRAQPQSGDQNEDAILSRITRNHIVAMDENGKYNNALFLKGTILLINKHFLEDKKTLTLHSHRATDTAVAEINLSDCEILPITGVDIALVACPNHLGPFPDIMRYVLDEPINAKTTGVVTRRLMDNTIRLYEVPIHKGRVIINSCTVTGKRYETHCDVAYKFRHARGDCGNIVMARVGGNLRIMGMHAFGANSDPELSLAVLLNRTELQLAMQRFDKKALYARSDDFEFEGDLIYEDGVSLNKQMFVARSTRHIISPGKTSLRPSVIHDLVHPHTTEPAKLRRVGDQDPVLNDLTKYALSTKQYPREHVQMAAQSLKEELLAHQQQSDLCRALTLFEALNGIPGTVESVDLSTSSGYPFSLFAKMRGPKRLVIEGEPGSLSLGGFAQQHFNNWQEKIDNGIVPNDPFIVTLKDERRKIAKVQAFQTRLFCAGSLTGFLHNKIQFGAFCAFLKRIRGLCFSTLGLNRSSHEWHELIMRQLEVGEFALDGDQKQWDGRFKAGVAMACVDIIAAFYKYAPESLEYQRLYILFLQAVFPLLRLTWTTQGFSEQFWTLIFEVFGCMPSGWFLTFVLNSLVNAMLFRIAWINLVSKPFNDLRYFRQYTRDKYAGDDNLASVATEFLDEFNNLTLQAFFAQYEQIYTSADKSGDMVPYKKLVDCQFLKLTTGRLYDRYVPLFEMDANLDTINWIRKCDDELAATESNCNDVLRNLFFYGQSTFNLWREKMLAVEPRLNLIMYQPLREAYLDYGSIPDPTGAFTYSKSNRGDPTAFYRAVQKSIDQKRKTTAEEQHGDLPGNTSTNMSKYTSNDGLTKEQPVAPGATKTDQTQGSISNLDEANPIVTTKEGVNLAEQQQVVVKKGVDGNASPMDRRADAHLNENDWDLAKMLRRENLVGAFPWSLTDTVGSELSITGSGSLPTDVPADLLKNDIASAPFLRFQWFRCSSIKVRIQLTASRFHQGRLLAYYVPTMLPKSLLNTGAINYGPTRATQVQHLFLDPANGFVGELDIPFRYNKGFIDLVFGDALGQIHVQVLNALQAATGASTSVEVKVFVSFENPHFRVPRPGGASFETLKTLAARSGMTVTPNAITAKEQQKIDEMKKKMVIMSRELKALREQRATMTSSFIDDAEVIDATEQSGGLFTPGNVFSFQEQTEYQLKQLRQAIRSIMTENAERLSILEGQMKALMDQSINSRLNNLDIRLVNTEIGQVTQHIEIDRLTKRVTLIEDDLRTNDRTACLQLRNEMLKLKIRTQEKHDLLMAHLDLQRLRIDEVIIALDKYQPILTVEATEQSGAFERVGGAIGTELDKLAADIMPSEVSGMIAGIALDKPAATEYPEPLVHKDAQYMSASRGIEKLERMTLEPGAQYITTDQFGDNVDEMDMKYLLKKDVYLTTFRWSATDAVGSILYSSTVSPTHFQDITLFPSLGSAVEPTPITALANLHTYWKGGFILKFMVAGTAFHEGRLDFCNHPGVSNRPSDYVTALSQYVNSQTIRNTDNNVEVRIPFHSDTPWKRVWFGETISDTAGSGAVRAMDYVTGSFSVRVAVPLKNPNNVANNVDVNVFISAADDFELHTLSVIGGILSPFTPAFREQQRKRRNRHYKGPKTIEATEQAGDLNTDPKTDAQAIVLGVGNVYVSEPPVHHFGETYTSLREACKRYWMHEFNDFTLSSGNGNIGNVFSFSDTMGGLFGYLSLAYRLMRGPMNGKFQIEVTGPSGAPPPKITGFITNNPQPAVQSDGSLAGLQRCLSPSNSFLIEPRAPPLVRFSADQVAEFQVPFQSIYHSLIMDQPAWDATGGYFDNQFFLMDLPWCISTADTFTPVAHVWTSFAFADETRFGVFLGFPPMLKNQGGVSYPNPGS